MKIPQALIIEDSREISLYFSNALIEAGYEVDCLTNGLTAQNYLEQHVPDLVVLDLHLPEISGERLLQQIRDNSRFDQTKIIIVTADARRGDYLRDVVDLVLHKPVSFAQLRDLSSRLTAGMPQLETHPLNKLVDGERP